MEPVLAEDPPRVHVDLHHRRLGDPGVLLAGQQRAHLPGGCVGCLREGAWCAVRGGHRCLHLWHLHRLPHHHWRSRGQDHCCSGEGARGSWEQLLVHRPQVHHQHHRLPPHPAPLHPQRDWLPKICQFPHLGGRGAAEHRAATVPYFRACVPPFCMLEEAGGAAFNCIVSYLWSWQSSRKESHSLSVIGTWYVTAVIIIKYIWPDKELVPVEIPTSPSTWTAVFNAMPTICFGFQCHVSSVPVFNSMKQPEVKTWGAVVTAAMVIALFVYTGTGACGFLTFGAGVEQDVLMSYPSNDIPVALARAFIILCVLTSYPILHFCGRAVLEGLWLRYTGVTVEEDVVRERRRRLLQTISWFLLTLLLALFIPDIGKVISVIGGLAACFIFVFPGLCLIQAKLSEIQETKAISWWAQVSYGVFMVTLGAFIFGQTTANAIFVDLTA
ncbi:putative sodium-coupled neutral amino acid transporter 7 isoform X2 [Corvus moneduloides]|uniref:putative sodium-coupled neutral amino acid transporter 7 isoform X2 n=1 Tax=Corvus moneduloides TaxID=1196302 RepID=UPI001363EA36|nr:putative sodium-coupled neutral amino acid transporter 7 isoform X2 [Corvus moneduloides]